MTQKSFTLRSRQFIESLVRQRQYLNANGLTKSDPEYMAYLITWFSTQLKMVHYSDRQMAAFWLRHHDRIQALIPGLECRSAKTLTTRFNDLKDEAYRISAQCLITPVHGSQPFNSQYFTSN